VTALDAVATWPFARAAAAVVGPDGMVSSSGHVEDALEWASVTKLATAMAVWVAVEEGTLALDDGAGPPDATVRHLLAHASGLAFDSDDVLARPGVRRIYSNRGYERLAGVLAERADMPFGDYLRGAVLEPLGMAGTMLHGTAAAGLAGPLVDLARLTAELLRPRLVSADTARLARSVAFPGLDGVVPGFGRQSPNDWGLGPELRAAKSPHWTPTSASPATFGHFGRAGGFTWVDPQVDVACCCLTDRTFGRWAVEAWPSLGDAVLDEWVGRDHAP
jgi:CubicO group peptidase (beta-lactamase class C family)